ncbi:phosphatase PAP2 family protein [Caldimonas aquatica]|uniref:Phosphatase PAP2 family protein n=1 Tax=Caldimonas aquatica TaxID=376175 RepID=A0ABY6MTB4_9BURK|nr:phosphatase PAP2 family protein [Schlegelella aquatica]UZD55255.1 phosphatase PAP2 family protein [Schlegelella aquatica]
MSHPLLRPGGCALRGLAFGWALLRERGLLVPLGLLAAVSLAAWVFLELAGEVVEGETLALDRALLLALRDPADLSDPLGPWWVELMMRDITALGSTAVLALVGCAALGYLLLAGKWGSGLLVAASVGGGLVASQVLKLWIERPRPDLVPHGVPVLTLSFPSGHATMSAVVYLTLGALLAGLQPRRRMAAYILAVAVLLTGLVGVSRVYLGVHWPTDVLAGWALGAAWALLCLLVSTVLRWRAGQRLP